MNMSTNGVTSKQLKSKLMNGLVFVAVQARDEMQSLDTESMLPVKGDYNDRSKICTQPVPTSLSLRGRFLCFAYVCFLRGCISQLSTNN